MSASPVLTNADDGEARWGLGGLLLFKVAGDPATGRKCIVEERMVRGCATPAHRHAADDETFIVLEGELALWIEGVTSIATPGSVAYVPAGLVHAWRVESDQARTLVVTTPEHELFYRDATAPAPAPVQPPDAGTVDIDAITRAAQRHGVELFGPPWTADEPEFRSRQPA